MNEPRTEIKLFYRFSNSIECTVTFKRKVGTLQPIEINEIKVREAAPPASVYYDKFFTVLHVECGRAGGTIPANIMAQFHQAVIEAVTVANTFLGLFSDT